MFARSVARVCVPCLWKSINMVKVIVRIPVTMSAVRSNEQMDAGFLKDERRICVALTRARQGLVVIGAPATLCSCRWWSAWHGWLERRGCRSTPRRMCAAEAARQAAGIAAAESARPLLCFRPRFTTTFGLS